MHGVRFVSSGDLPPEHDFVLVQQGDDMWLFIKEDRVTPRVLEEAWNAYLHSGDPSFGRKLRLA